MKFVRKLPQFSELPEAERTIEAVQAAWHEPPHLLMTLKDLEQSAACTRGVYDTTRPDVDTELCFKNGISSTQYLNREPDWRKGHRRQQETISLTEVTPLEDEKGFLNYRWFITVIGEAEQRTQADMSALILRRAEAA